MLGDGNELPLADASIDLLTYAQAWHWTDQGRSVPEARRGLTTGGALALWWIDSDGAVSWLADQDTRLRRLFGAVDSPYDPVARFRKRPAGLGFAHRQVSWKGSVPLETHLGKPASYSDFLVHGKERDLLAEVFPKGMVEEHYVVSLAVATM